MYLYAEEIVLGELNKFRVRVENKGASLFRAMWSVEGAMLFWSMLTVI